jgi:hypothetical protein
LNDRSRTFRPGINPVSRRNNMLKSFALSAATLVALAAPTFAMDETVRCTAANKEHIMQMAEKNPDKAMMKKAMKALDMASQMAAAGDFAGCREDLMKAMKAAESK